MSLTDPISPAHLRAAHAERLLIVDDNPLIRELHAIVLRFHGYQVTTAQDGVEALEKLAETNYDLLLVDRQMPRLDGASVVLAIRSAGGTLPVVMVSGSAEFDPLPRAIADEIACIIPKPARSNEVLTAVSSALSSQGHRGASRQYIAMAA